MNKPKICWDSNVVIAWFREEKDKPLADIALVVERIDAGQVTLILPVTVISELLEGKFKPEQWERLQQWRRRSNIIPAPTTPIIAEKAATVRQLALEMKEHRSLKTPDATIIATAILHQVRCLHTLEPKLQKLSGSPVVDSLKILPPQDLYGHRGLIAPQSDPS